MTCSTSSYTGTGIAAIAAGDMDHDGTTDLAVAEQTGSNGMVVVVGGTHGRRCPREHGPRAGARHDVLGADLHDHAGGDSAELDGDGHTDIAYATPAAVTVMYECR